MMKSLIVLFALIGAASAQNEAAASAQEADSCLTGATADKAVTTVCFNDDGAATAAKNCKMPTFTSYSGFDASVEWGCGECGTTSGCDQCAPDSIADDCNAVVETETFECYAWSYVTTGSDSTWTQGEATTCYIKKTGGEDPICNAPDRNTADESDNKYTISLGGCGPCSEENEKTAKTCLECNGDKCNGSAALSVSAILAVISFLYMM